jgi:hypothetical protein
MMKEGERELAFIFHPAEGVLAEKIRRSLVLHTNDIDVRRNMGKKPLNLRKEFDLLLQKVLMLSDPRD